MEHLWPIGHGVRCLTDAAVAFLLFRHVLRFRPTLAATAGSRFPSLYWAFGAIFALDSLESAAAVPWPAGSLRMLLAMARDATTILTIDRLWRSQEESAALWRSTEGRTALGTFRDAARAVVQEYGRANGHE